MNSQTSGALSHALLIRLSQLLIAKRARAPTNARRRPAVVPFMRGREESIILGQVRLVFTGE
jgi:hypothetical protein